jgi:tol-pal system protein YbgF
MHKHLNTFKVLSIAMCLGIAMPVFAESAPVYDADAMPQQFDNSPDQAQQDMPPPPPAAPGQESAFVPVQPGAQSGAQSGAPNLQVSPAASASPASSMGVEQRIKRLEQQVESANSTARIDALQSQVQSLQGQVEQLTRQLQVAQSQQKTMYADLDKRLGQSASKGADASLSGADDVTAATTPVAKSARKTALKQVAKVGTDEKAASETGTVGAVASKSSESKNSDDQPNVAEEQQIYQTAYNLIKSKKYNDAVVALQNMLQKYPSGQFASNAHYWLGELYGLMGKNDQSLTEFGLVVKNYPDSPRVSDAQLKIGLIFASQSKWSDAKLSFKKVVSHYPGTASARLASEQMKQIKQAGH